MTRPRLGCLLGVLLVGLVIAAIVVGATTGSIPGLGFSGPRLDGCGYQKTTYYNDNTSRVTVQGCVAPGFPKSIPLLQSRIVTGRTERGDNNYERFDVVIETADLDAAQSSISEQLGASGYRPGSNDDVTTPHLVFENDTYKIYLTFTQGGLHGDTVEYFIVPAS
ncbi:hypothetical protein BH09ACT6_BH09ACT6_10610 [soil metagenome]